MHTHTHTNTQTHTHTDYTKLDLRNLKLASNRNLRWMKTAAQTKWKTQNLPDSDLTKHYLDIHKSPSVEQYHHCSPTARAVRSEPELPSAGNASAPLRHQSYRQTSEE